MNVASKSANEKYQNFCFFILSTDDVGLQFSPKKIARSRDPQGHIQGQSAIYIKVVELQITHILQIIVDLDCLCHSFQTPISI